MKKWFDLLWKQLQKHFPRAKQKKQYGDHPFRLEKDQLGLAGETQAIRFLKSQGYKIIDTNVQYEDGELDIVSRNRDVTVFVEVKTRRPHPVYHPSMAVTKKKQKKIKQLAFRYLGPTGRRTPIRFDVIAITWSENEPPVIEHITDAFQ